MAAQQQLTGVGACVFDAYGTLFDVHSAAARCRDDLGEKASICFMSSNAWDAAGAAYFGFQVTWVNRFGQPKERLPGEPSAEINTLEPLLGLVCV